jgi:hypothetical protein
MRPPHSCSLRNVFIGIAIAGAVTISFSIKEKYHAQAIVDVD